MKSARSVVRKEKAHVMTDFRNSIHCALLPMISRCYGFRVVR
jgi:hypothetical protein